MMKRMSSRLMMAAALLAYGSSHSFAQDAAEEITLDGIVVTGTKTEESWIDALSASSVVDRGTLDVQFNADRVSEVLRTIPGVTTQESARDTATAINIRGLQDFGRVNVLIDGARQNFQRTGHGPNGSFYIEPEMIKRVDITRGPTATIYGSGAIGGVAAFETLDADDILRPGEYAAVRGRTSYGSNGDEKLGSGTTAVRVDNFDILGQFNARRNGDYEDGNGNTVPGSNDDTDSKLVKLRFRPAEGHQITGSLIDYDSEFIDEVEQDGSRYDTEVKNRQYTLGYSFQSPTNALIDFNSKIYYNETSLGQERLTGGDATYFSPIPGPGGMPCPFPTLGPCFMFPGAYPVGALRSFNTETQGFDIWNTSRFDVTDGVKMALTYGGDGFQDTVNTIDPASTDAFTPSGERTIYGAFVQSKVTFFDVVDVIGALRYDNYELDGGGVNVKDDRVSPKITVGVTPIEGMTLFGTWAEGFRAPHLSETLISGFHPGFAHFQLRPNPDLVPEVAENIEAGVNFKYDNVITTGDAFRAKITAFRNKVSNYIDQVFVEGPIDGILTPFPPPDNIIPVFIDDYLQYQNINNATLDGIEFETFYDAGKWFAGVGAHRIRGNNDDTGQGLFSVPADQLTLTAGFRALDDKLVAGGRVRFVAAQDRFVEGGTASTKHTEAYNVVDLFAQYEAHDNVTLNLNIDNLFNENYRQHLDQYNSPGFSARAGLTMRFGASE